MPAGYRSALRWRLLLEGVGLGSKRAAGRGGAIDSVVDAIDAFYANVLQQVTAWTASPPKLRETPVAELSPEEPAKLVSTALSSQDGPQPTTGDINVTPNGPAEHFGYEAAASASPEASHSPDEVEEADDVPAA